MYVHVNLCSALGLILMYHYIFSFFLYLHIIESSYNNIIEQLPCLQKVTVVLFVWLLYRDL